jgi:general stress protein 26
MTREEQLATVREVLQGESFAVFAFAGEPSAPPSSAVMFFAETPDLRVIFGTSEGSAQTAYARDGNGVCVQIDTRGVGVDHMSAFARISLQGRLRLARGPDEIAALQSVYLDKLPFAKVFLDRPGVLTFAVEPQRLVFARGFGERFDLEFR